MKLKIILAALLVAGCQPEVIPSGDAGTYISAGRGQSGVYVKEHRLEDGTLCVITYWGESNHVTCNWSK